jgi:hypothetical protein
VCTNFIFLFALFILLMVAKLGKFFVCANFLGGFFLFYQENHKNKRNYGSGKGGGRGEGVGGRGARIPVGLYVRRSVRPQVDDHAGLCVRRSMTCGYEGLAFQATILRKQAA